jgi:DNA-binding NarL/FixJ family response regulator
LGLIEGDPFPMGVVLSRTRVVVLKAPTLFTEGIAARLGQHPEEIELAVVDSRDADALAKTIASRPEVVLFEAHDENLERSCPLVDLLEAVPTVKVIRLDSSQDRVQIVTSEQRSVNEPIDLIDMLLPS